jgi:dynein heavy chain 2
MKNIKDGDYRYAPTTHNIEIFMNVTEIISNLFLQLTELSGDLGELPLQALLAAAFISYLPGVAEEQRRALLIGWQQNLGLVDFSLARFLASEQQLLQWQSEGLPSDQVSLENAVVILQVCIS